MSKWKLGLAIVAAAISLIFLLNVVSYTFFPEKIYTGTDRSPAITREPSVIGFTYKLVEANNTWWKYSWQITVDNPVESPIDCRLTIRFLDADDYVLHKDWHYENDVPASQATVISSYTLVDTDIAYKVSHLDCRLD